MKRIIPISLAAAATLFAACQKQNTDSVLTGEKVDVTVSVSIPQTKATGSFSSNESTVSGVQIFCFDKKTGIAEKYVASSSSSATLSITTGTKHIYALANCPSLSSITSESELLATVTNFSNNSLSSFEMISPVGTDSEYSITDSGNLELTVKRIVAKVLIDKITAAFTSVGLQSQDFIINKIYLANVAKSNKYDLSLTPSEYYVGSEDNGANVNAMIQETGLSYNLKNNGSSTVLHGFYVYPNNSSNKTKVVIEAKLLDADQVYSFDLPAIERNKIYDVTEIKITRQSGNLSDMNVTIKVSDWDGTTTVSDLTY